MVMFGAATSSGDALAVRKALPDLPPRMAGRLSYTARLAHQRWAYHEPPSSGHDLNPEISPSIEVSM
jgi:hypothetical protein